ncbi:PAS domain-containing protein [Halorarius halobius]|uniref:PAS domain-containing protein n=1 Tax=Halorarius halobius TaxID=2962671 RepID=UPI0020CE3BB8|nr:PAS domain-containing protein [Halorarius halobius]
MATGERAVRESVHESGAGQIRVLHLDDDEMFLELTATSLEREEFDVVSLSDPQEALDRLCGDVDCIVSDYQMPEMDGIEFLESVREDCPNVPFLLFTGKGSEDIAGRAISAGVTDYLQKSPGQDQFALLANRIENAVSQHRAQERVREVHDRIDDAVVALDSDWRYTYVNRRAEELLGVDAADLEGNPIWETYPGLVGSEFEEAFREAVRTQEPTTVEAYHDLTESWYETRAYPDENGLSVYFRDVTERRERELQYEAVFNQTYQFTGLLEPDGTVLEANETALSFGGLDREDVVGEKVWDTEWFQHGDAATVARAFVDRAADGEFARTDLEVQGAEGVATIDFSVRPVTDDDGEVVLLIPEGRDITELKQQEEQLREERAFVDGILEALPDPLYAFDAEGNFLRWNDEFEAVTGYGADEISEMTPLDFIPADEQSKIADSISAVFDSERTVTVESHFERTDGTRVPYEFTGARLDDESGDPIGLVGIGRDITDRKRRERELRRQNQRLEEFANVVSHGLQNRLSVATGSLELAETDDEHLRRAQQALDRMRQLTEDVLRLAEQGEVVDDPQAVTARDAIDEAVTAVALDDATVTVDCPPDRRIRADATRLPELIENLLVNAAEHGGSEVTVGLDGDTLYVADDGPGIPPEKRERVLEAGYSSDGGTGFGLAIVISIAEAHGWEVDIRESERGGARIEVSGIESA